MALDLLEPNIDLGIGVFSEIHTELVFIIKSNVDVIIIVASRTNQSLAIRCNNFTKLVQRFVSQRRNTVGAEQILRHVPSVLVHAVVSLVESFHVVELHGSIRNSIRRNFDSSVDFVSQSVGHALVVSPQVEEVRVFDGQTVFDQFVEVVQDFSLGGSSLVGSEVVSADIIVAVESVE